MHHRCELCADGPRQPADGRCDDRGQQPECRGRRADGAAERHGHAADRNRDGCSGDDQLHDDPDDAVGYRRVSGSDCTKRSGELHHRWQQCCTGNLRGSVFAADLHGQLPDRDAVGDGAHDYRDACG